MIRKYSNADPLIAQRLSPKPANLLPLFLIFLFVVLCVSIQACSSKDCDTNFIKKSRTELGESYQSEKLNIHLTDARFASDSFSCLAFKNLNGEIKLTFESSSDYSHFSDE
jgi:hypothetical protein